MEGNIICKKFKRFLKENGVYYQYRKNFYEQTKTRKDWCNRTYVNKFSKYVGDSLQELCEGIKDKRFILNFSFYWTETPQGHEFWDEISYRFVDMLYFNDF